VSCDVIGELSVSDVIINVSTRVGLDPRGAIDVIISVSTRVGLDPRGAIDVFSIVDVLM
jgi:hypothetical protein